MLVLMVMVLMVMVVMLVVPTVPIVATAYHAHAAHASPEPVAPTAAGSPSAAQAPDQHQRQHRAHGQHRGQYHVVQCLWFHRTCSTHLGRIVIIAINSESGPCSRCTRTSKWVFARTVCIRENFERSSELPGNVDYAIFKCYQRYRRIPYAVQAETHLYTSANGRR